MSVRGEAGLHGEGHELLLSAVVDVALELAALVVLGGDEALLGGLQVGESGLEGGGQPLVPQDETRLGREVAHELLLGRIHRIVRRHRHRERPQQLALMAHLRREVVARGRASPPARRRPREAPRRSTDDTRARSAPTPSPSTRAMRDEHVVGRVRLGELIAEGRHHLVGRGALAVDDPVGESPRTCAHRLEDERHDGGRERGEDRAAPRSDECADSDHQADVHERR